MVWLANPVGWSYACWGGALPMPASRFIADETAEIQISAMEADPE